nr:hypothetical protein [Anoxybacillus flavithermus]
METHEQLKRKINDLEEEVKLYKRFIEHIPFPFSYVDHEIGKMLKKENDISTPIVERIKKMSDKNQ